MMSPNRPTSRTGLLSNKTIRITVVISVIAIAATALASVNSSARSLGQRLVAGAAAIISGAPETRLAPVSHSLASEAEASAPMESSTMMTARRGHTATHLSDGRVLIAGGDSAGGGYLNEAEIFDPASGTFSVVAATLIKHTDNAA